MNRKLVIPLIILLLLPNAITAQTDEYRDDYDVVMYTTPQTTPSLSELPLQSSITQHGITWTFDGDYRVGRFVNGDYYVIGPVTITNIDPLPTPSNGRHGSVINIPNNNQISGFDDRTQGNRYTSSLRVYPPFDLNPGNSLISTISATVVGENDDVMQSDTVISPVRTASVLTCLDSPVPADAFRPTYANTDKDIYYSHYLNRDLLLSLESSGITFDGDYISNFGINYFRDIYQRAWIDTLQYNFDVPSDYATDYARENGRAVGMASLLLNLDYTPQEKEALLVYFVQYGIDLHGAVRSGIYGWPAHGGHGTGRKWPIIFAGLMLDQEDMKFINDNYPDTRFGEDMQTYSAIHDDPVWGTNYGTSWTGADSVYAGHRGIWQGSPTVSRTDWQPYEHEDPIYWESNTGEGYRRCCTSVAWVAQALAARLMCAMDEWGHNAFFDYVDRWMVDDDDDDVAYILSTRGWDYTRDWQSQGQAWDTYTESMWSAYRAYADTIDCGSPQTCSDGQTRSCSTGEPGICSSGTETCTSGVWGDCIQDTSATTELCSGGLDEDCDGSSDCSDSDCSSDSSCQSCSDLAGSNWDCCSGSETCDGNQFSGATDCTVCCNQACTPSQYFSAGVDIEAEDGVITFPMQIGADAQASGGQYVATDSVDLGTVSFMFDITTAGNYMMEVRLRTPEPNMGGHNSFYVYVDDETAVNYNVFHAIETNAWNMDNVSREGDGDYSDPEFDPVKWYLTEDLHTFIFQGRELDTQLDLIRLLSAEQTYHEADLDNSCDIDIDELMVFMNRWKVSIADVGMVEMMDAIALWKFGNSCS